MVNTFERYLKELIIYKIVVGLNFNASMYLHDRFNLVCHVTSLHTLQLLVVTEAIPVTDLVVYTIFPTLLFTGVVCL